METEQCYSNVATCDWHLSGRSVGGEPTVCKRLPSCRPTDAIVNLTTIKAIVIKSKNYLNYIHHQKLFSTIPLGISVIS